MGNPVRVITIESLEEKIEELEIVKNKVKEALNIECTCIEDVIMQRYIELQKGLKVADYLNDKGYRIRSNGKLGQRKYNSNDITEVITSPEKESNTNKVLHELALALYKFNVSKLAWITVVRLCRTL